MRELLLPAITDVDAGPLQRVLVAVGPDMADAELPPITAALRARFGRCIQDLANDDIRGNAIDAMGTLQDAAALPLLAEALGSRDVQQRQLAASVMRDLGAPPSAELGRVTVETLDDSISNPLFGTVLHHLSDDAVRYLYHHPGLAVGELRRALWSPDANIRFRAAFLLACRCDPPFLTTVVREMIDHLCDNQITGDAMMACHALHMLGRKAEGALVSWRHHQDPQAARLIELLLIDLDHPPRTDAELRQRRSMHEITCLYHDPAVEFDIRRAYIPH